MYEKQIKIINFRSMQSLLNRTSTKLKSAHKNVFYHNCKRYRNGTYKALVPYYWQQPFTEAQTRIT